MSTVAEQIEAVHEFAEWQKAVQSSTPDSSADAYQAHLEAVEDRRALAGVRSLLNQFRFGADPDMTIYITLGAIEKVVGWTPGPVPQVTF